MGVIKATRGHDSEIASRPHNVRKKAIEDIVNNFKACVHLNLHFHFAVKISMSIYMSELNLVSYTNVKWTALTLYKCLAFK